MRRSVPSFHGSPGAQRRLGRRCVLTVAFLAACLCAGLVVRFAAADDVSPAPAAAEPVEILLFVRDGCPHCEHAEDWLERLAAERGGLTITVLSITEDETALPRLKALAEAAQTRTVATPAIAVPGGLVIGWTGDATGRRVVALLDREAGAASGVDDASCSVELDAEPCEEEGVIDLPLFGRVRLGDVGLPLFTLFIGLVDGFNPCAMWVLLFLLSILVNLKSRAKMLAIAGTFVLVSGLVYFAFMAAWLNFFLVVGIARWATVALGVLAVFVGVVHVKDFFAFHKGLTLSIPEGAKPGIYARARRIVNAEHLGGAMLGVVALAFMVNTVELLCTAGLPAIYTKVLTNQGLSTPAYYGYLALYQVFYMLDDAAMLTIAVVTLSRRKLQETGGRWLKLVSGVVILALGLVLLLKPGWLYW